MRVFAFGVDAIPHIGRLMENDLASLLAWSQHLVLAQKPSTEHAEMIRGARVPVLDLVRAPGFRGYSVAPTASGTEAG